MEEGEGELPLEPKSLEQVLDEAQKALERDEPAVAQALAQDILAHFPSCLTALQILGKALQAQDRHRDALTAFSRVVNIDPLDLAAHEAMAASAREIGIDRQASFYESIAQDHHSGWGRELTPVPDSISPSRLAVLQERTGLYAQASSTLMPIVREGTNRLDLYLLLARSLYGLDARDEAGSVVTAILTVAPDCLEAHILGAALSAGFGLRDEALAHLESAYQCDPLGQRIESSHLVDRLLEGVVKPDTGIVPGAALDLRQEGALEGREEGETDIGHPEPASPGPSGQYASQDRATSMTGSSDDVGDSKFEEWFQKNILDRPGRRTAENAAEESPAAVVDNASSDSGAPTVQNPAATSDTHMVFSTESSGQRDAVPVPAQAQARVSVVHESIPNPAGPAASAVESPSRLPVSFSPPGGTPTEPREDAAASDRGARRGARRWPIPAFEWRKQDQPLRSQLADLAERVEREPLNNGLRLKLAQALETVDPAQSVAQYVLIVQSRDPRLLGDVQTRLEDLLAGGSNLHGLQRLLGDVYMQQGAYERAIEAYSLAFDELRSRQITDRARRL